METFLFKMEECRERETSEILAGRLRGLVAELAALKCTATASVQDNAANVKKAAGMVFKVSINCAAHTGNLYCEDLGEVFKRQFEQCSH